MQTKRILQAVVLMIVVAVATSCAASKEYSSKLFKPRTDEVKDSQSVALRFLELDKIDSDKENWVSTDIIMGRDTAGNTWALDKLAKTFPAVAVSKDTTITVKEEEKTTPVLVETKPAVIETKPLPVTDHPIAKNYNTGEVRNKKTREK